MKVHLMFKNRDVDAAQVLPSLRDDVIQDLNLGTLLDAMAASDDYLRDVALRTLVASLNEPDEIHYRQQVYRDCAEHPEIIRELYDVAVGAIEGERKVFTGFFRERPEYLLHRSITVLELFLQPLHRLRQIAADSGDGVQSDGLTTLFRMLQSELSDDYFAEVGDHLRQLKFRHGLLLSAEMTIGNRGTGYVLRTAGKTKQSWKQWIGLDARSAYSFEIAARDEAGSNALAELRDRGLDPVANALAQSTDHILSFFKMMRSELGFYVGCLNLAGVLAEGGHPTSEPIPDPWSELSLASEGLYDISLALRSDRPIIGNRVAAGGKSLIVITGANSGGKSTFLRSVGLAQLMMLCGMFVPAESFRGSVCDAVFTHFIREEDASMDSGRLDDELSRMSRITDQLTPQSMILFNESFAATNEREGSEIARQIIRALTESGVRVFIVTHLFDLANGLYQRRMDDTLFLRAEREPDGQRSYALVEKPPLSTSFGEDLYLRLGQWDVGEAPVAATVSAESSSP